MNLLSLFSNRRPVTTGAAHMTWAKSSVGRSISRTGLLLKKQLWIWPIIAIVLLSGVGFLVRSSIERTMKANLTSQLQTLLDVETAMVETWVKTQTSNAQTLANDHSARQEVYKLLAAMAPADDGDQAGKAALLRDARRRLQQELGPSMTTHQYTGFVLLDRERRIIASTYEELIGRQDIHDFDSFLARVFEGESVVTPPYASLIAIKDESGNSRTGVPTAMVFAPVRDESFQVVGVLALRIRPEQEFTRILQLGRIGKSGETYAFNRAGVMVTNSRFDEDLVLLGLLPDEEGTRSILNLQLRDPGQDMTRLGRPRIRRVDMPLTRMAASAVAGSSGIDVDGYRDYRGVPVIGTWRWLPKLELGIATEIDSDEAFRPLVILRRTFWTLFTLLALGAVAIFVFTLMLARLRREAQRAAIEARELGQYKLERKLGAGAIGVVYKAYHAMLRRPTAIKMLNLDKVDEASTKRFEHEVQITCQLNHPNTIAIYDYGRTPEGVFYYAMEYLDGIDLQALVEKYGPQPEGRVISILRQMCGSLYEAHTKGLVHRDIKPANVMLNRRGAQPDVVKVLDFGLVKAVDQEKGARLSAANSLTGTPLYMSPEAIQSPMLVDACSDLYAVGAVGYFLLTGQPVFNAASIVDLLQHHVSATPISPAERLGKPVSSELEHAILACLEKSRANRPQTARNLAELLERCPTSQAWSMDDADAWWSRHERGQATPAGADLSSTAAASHEQTMIFKPK